MMQQHSRQAIPAKRNNTLARSFSLCLGMYRMLKYRMVSINTWNVFTQIARFLHTLATDLGYRSSRCRKPEDIKSIFIKRLYTRCTLDHDGCKNGPSVWARTSIPNTVPLNFRTVSSASFSAIRTNRDNRP